MKVFLAQIDTTVGDLEGNGAKIIRAIEEARTRSADVAVFPELTITGYPPRDLLEKDSFVWSNREVLGRIAAAARGVAAVVGFVERNETGSGKGLYNAAALCEQGRVVQTVAKCLLPTYDVFDEDRHFDPGRDPGLLSLAGRKVGLSICEDAWTDPAFFGRRRYGVDPIAAQAAQGADLFLNISASPFALGRPAYRERLFSAHAAKHQRPLVYVNLVGGNDDLLFDGRSQAFGADGSKLAELAPFREDFLCLDVDAPPPLRASPPMDDAEEAFEALVMGTRDYAVKCSFSKAVVALSGGIDSSVVAAIAVAALGAGAVTGVSMPSRFSSKGSVEDAAALAANLGIRTLSLSIEPVFEACLETLARPFEGLPTDVTEENLQSRIRGTLLMALSNKFRWLVLATGNKSEMAVGYTTLYGDMSGGLAVISDVPKTLVYRIARHINRQREIIPAAVLTKPPSAELRPDQRDQDTLPPYEVLDEILRLYVEEQRPVKEIVAAGFDEETAREIVKRVTSSEYKRKQAPPGLRITTKAFGLGRRLPIAQRYREP